MKLLLEFDSGSGIIRPQLFTHGSFHSFPSYSLLIIFELAKSGAYHHWLQNGNCKTPYSECPNAKYTLFSFFSKRYA